MSNELAELSTSNYTNTPTDAKSEKSSLLLPICPRRKIKVFISSICGNEKYDKIRDDLKKRIESTQLATAYAFEKEPASTLSAEVHYESNLKESDICIFLIDNADGVTSGVQKEIEIVKKHNIKALYYFCDETQKEKTAFEQSILGAHFAKSKTVHTFNELIQDSAQALIDDIVTIYHYYCNGSIVLRSNEADEIQEIEDRSLNKAYLPSIPKTTLRNVYKCSRYILSFVFGAVQDLSDSESEKTCSLDNWGREFLSILFDGMSIDNFNTTKFLGELKKQQESTYNQIVEFRWQAIQSYFSGDIEKCKSYLESALNHAKETSQQTWIIKDILIDLRNVHLVLCTSKNVFSNSYAQSELTESNEDIYYPILDRINESLHENYIKGLYRQKTESPYSVTIGNDFNKYGEILASALIVSMYNGSLTYILLIYDRIKEFLFYLSGKHSDWILQFNLYKLAIFSGNSKEIKGIQDAYPDILCKLSSDEAASIMNFCLIEPIKHKRLINQLLAFGSVGYFLDDSQFAIHEKHIINEIKDWLNSDVSIVLIGQSIFKCLTGVANRISQDVLSDICCLFIKKQYSRFYMDMFKFISNCIDLRKMNNSSAQNLVDRINYLLNDENDRKLINYAPAFLYVLRSQDNVLTEGMDKLVLKYFPNYYNGTYKLATIENNNRDLNIIVENYIANIKNNNQTQGENGAYFGHKQSEIAILRYMLLREDFSCNTQMMDSLISALSDTLIISKENISIKLDAISLLICIAVKYPEDYKRNQNIYEKIFWQEENIDVFEDDLIFSNIDSISLKIGLQFLFASIGKDVYCKVLELMPCIQGDIATTFSVTQLIVEYLENSETIMLPYKVEGIILQNVLQWLHSENANIKFNAMRILLMLSRNSENHGFVNNQLVNLVDSSDAHIKRYIVQNIYTTCGITETTRKYIVSKCKYDTNFIVRMACEEAENDNTNNE